MATIEDEFNKKFVGQAPDYHDPQTHASYPSTYTDKMLNIKEVTDWFKSYISSLMEEVKLGKQGRIGYRTAQETGYNEAISDQQSKIQKVLKEKGIL